MSGKQKECGYSWTSEGEIHTCSLPEGHTEAHICGFVFNPDDCCLERAAPTPPEGEAVPELSDFEGIPKGIANTVSGPEPPAPVVSTAAPEPLKVCKHCGENENHLKHQYDPWSEAHQVNDHEFEAVAPESYKPAEGPDDWQKWYEKTADFLLGLRKELGLPESNSHAIDHLIVIRSFLKKKGLLLPAATPVTVEAPEPQVQEAKEHFEQWWIKGNPHSDTARYAVVLLNALRATPKPIGDVEAVARQIATYVRGEFYKPLVCKPENDYLLEGIGKILSPFFAPAPPCSECATLQKQITEIAEAVSRMPTVTGLQESCVKDHSLITLAILDSQATFNDTVARKEAECATLRKERDEAKKSLESELHYTNCDKLHRERETKRHWQDRAEAAEAQLSTLRDALRGMLESYDLLIEQSQSHFKSETLKGVIEGSFVGEITRARKLLAPTPEVAPVKILRGQRKVSLELEHESEKGTHSIGEVAPKE